MNQMLQDAPDLKESSELEGPPETVDRPPVPAHPRFAKPQRVAFVQSSWHREVVEECRIAFLAESAARHITNIDVFEVPGSFEIPLHAQLLANHLIKIFQITQMYALPLPWGQVCIGSDFDGLIEAVDCCQDSTEFSLLAPALEQQLAAGAIAAGFDLQMDAAQIVEQFCYTNAFNFFNRHFG